MNLPGAKRRILVIDDSTAIHMDFRRILQQEPPRSRGELDALGEAIFGADFPSGVPASPPADYEVDSAFQGEEGVALVRQALAAGRPYCLVFLDHRMPPGWNGAETLRRLREVAPSLPVVLCSAYSDYSWAEMIREFGAGPLLREMRKPFDRQAVRQLVLTA